MVAPPNVSVAMYLWTMPDSAKARRGYERLVDSSLVSDSAVENGGAFPRYLFFLPVLSVLLLLLSLQIW